MLQKTDDLANTAEIVDKIGYASSLVYLKELISNTNVYGVQVSKKPPKYNNFKINRVSY